jgi:hypothetical protein
MFLVSFLVSRFVHLVRVALELPPYPPLEEVVVESLGLRSSFVLF